MSKEVFVDTKQLDRLAIELKGIEKEMPGAALSAINRTLDFVVATIGRIIPKSYAVKSKEVKESMRYRKKASKSDLAAYVVSKGYTLSLSHFPYSPKVPGTNRGIKVKIKQSEGYSKISFPRSKKSKKGEVSSGRPQPFVAPTGAKDESKTQYNVFRRTGKSRLPIIVLRTLSIPQMISNENIEPEIIKAAQDKLSERIEHEINWRLDSAHEKIKG